MAQGAASAPAYLSGVLARYRMEEGAGAAVWDQTRNRCGCVPLNLNGPIETPAEAAGHGARGRRQDAQFTRGFIESLKVQIEVFQ